MKPFKVFLLFSWFFFSLIVAAGVAFYFTGQTLYAPEESQAFLHEDVKLSERKSMTISAGAKMFPKDRVTMLFVGDIMLGRWVEELMEVRGASYPFDAIDEFLSSRDFVFGNLEGPIVYDHYQTPNGSTSFSFSEDKADALKQHHFDAVALGNNHTLDRGQAGYENTKEILDARGILYTGHAVEMGSEYALTTEVGDEEIDFVSFNVTFPANNEDAAVETVRTLAAESDNVMIVNVHWGIEYRLTSSAAEQEFAHRLVDAGADIIIGHHPHVTQEVELYKGKIIFYSLGNFIFDQYFSVHTQESLAVSLVVTDEVFAFSLHPLESQLSQISLMEKVKATNWLSDLADRSSPELAEQVRSGIIRVERPL